jgi:dipeptidase E
LEHAAEALRELYGSNKRILLINFASLPDDRDAYAIRMQKDFQRIDPEFRVDSLHQAKLEDAARVVREAEAFFVSGGNTFLLLRELYDRSVVKLLRERVLAGAPYAGSSAGSNIAGTCIGTTNDFPITDIPTRRSLGLFQGLYNPHHPEEEAADFGSRQWKIRNYARYNPGETIVGVPNAGMLRVRGDKVTLLGDGAVALVQKGATAERVATGNSIPFAS